MKTLQHLIAVASFVLAATSASAQQAQELKLGTMPLGSIWYVFGASMVKLIQPQLPPGSKIEIVPRGGGIGNPITVNEGKTEVAISNVATSLWAYEGEPEIYKGKKYQDIRGLLGGLNEIWITGILTEDYIKRTGNDTLEKALLSKQPPRIIMKPAGSSVPPVVRMILEGLGTSLDKLKAAGGQVLQVDVSQIPSMIRDGRADLYFESVSPGHPATTEVTLTTPVRFVDLPQKSLDYMAKQGLKLSTMPVHFKGQAAPIKAVDLNTSLIVNKSMPDQTAYAITKAIIEGRDQLVAENKAMSGFIAKDAWRPENNGIPLHPGAIKYYKEKGWM